MLSLLHLSLSLLALPGVYATPSSPLPANPATVGASILAGPKVAAAWYAGWHAADFPLSSVSWSKYTQMTYAFAETSPDVNVLLLAASDQKLLSQFVAAAHKNGVKASVSIGGWTGSEWYSSNVASARNRTAFVKTVANFAKKYKLDGIDFDWEYPGSQGIGCNVVQAKDTANFLSFLQELRKDPLGAKLILTAATAITPFAGPDGNPSKDVSGFSTVFDYIVIMNYDINGPWSAAVGPNAPLADSCAPAANQAGSATSAVHAWKAAGMPDNQIVLGVPSYGHSFRVSPAAAHPNGSQKLALYPAFDGSAQPAGDKWSDAAGPDVCGVQQSAGGSFDFWGLVDAGFLKSDGTPAKGIDYVYDSCSQTPYVYNKVTQVMVSFDDAKSFAAKGDFIKTNKLRGFAMWEAGGDQHDILINSIRASIGLN